MPTVSRSAHISAPPKRVWQLVSDPNSLPRWWPRVIRVEAVTKAAGGARSQWTKVLGTREGRGVRADYRCLHATNEKRYVWQQELEDSPFARHLSLAETEILLEPDGDGTRVTVISRQRMRGLSRIGGPLMRGAAKRLLDEALEGIEAAVGRNGNGN